MYIGVFAYGESRFELTFNPCDANIASLCPMNSSVPIEASGIIPVDQADVASIIPLALAIPDFEGQAILRIFANATETQIGCFSAIVTNGATFSHPAAVGGALGAFTVIAIAASALVTIYGDHIPTVRNHYAHSLSVFVVFAVFHHIFFLGAISMNWPSVLAAFWSNYAWTAGMIYSEGMQNTINSFIGSNGGNLSTVGAAASGENGEVTNQYQISAVYKRSFYSLFKRDANIPSHRKDILASRSLEKTLQKRMLANHTSGYKWYGHAVRPGLPLPGNYSGFAGELSHEEIPASNAFMTGFLWLLILLACTGVAVILFKWTLEALSGVKAIRRDRFAYFRSHWLGFTGVALLRVMFIAFFMMTTLTLFQFTFQGPIGVRALAAVVFFAFFVGMFGLASYACFYRLRFGHYASEPDRINLERQTKLKFIPWFKFSRASSAGKGEKSKAPSGSLPWWRLYFVDNNPERSSVVNDEEYLKKFGWLAARFRRTRWWFFIFWLVYEFVRASFFGGGASSPMTQAIGLVVVESIALIATIILRPFEGTRLNLLMIYALGFSKVTTTGLSIAFHPRFNLDRIVTTVIGIVIIVIQGILTILLLIAILVGAVTSYMSLTRNREDFKPRSWAPLRTKYFAHINDKVPDLPPPPPPVPEEPKPPGFSVGSVKRYPKIEDDDDEFVQDIKGEGDSPNESQFSVAAIPGPSNSIKNRPYRSGSMRSNMSYTTVPYGARVHRASWSQKDFEAFNESGHRIKGMASDGSLKNSAGRMRSNSRAGMMSRSGTPGLRADTPMSGLEELKETRSRGEEPPPPNREFASADSSNRSSAVVTGEEAERKGKEKDMGVAL